MFKASAEDIATAIDALASLVSDGLLSIECGSTANKALWFLALKHDLAESVDNLLQKQSLRQMEEAISTIKTLDR